MTSPLPVRLAILPAAALGLALLALAPAQAATDAEGRAVAQCRAELVRQFPEGALSSHRVGTISGNARRTRVTLYANADRRYTFDCVADGDGRIVTAALSPPNATRLAAEARGAQPQ